MDDPVIAVLLLVVGAVLTAFGGWVHAWIERQTSTSSDLYKQRLDALNDIWRTFLPVKDIYAMKIPLGHKNWQLNKADEVLKTLNVFREKVDEKQVVLPKEVLSELRKLDSYLFEVLNANEQAPSEHVKQLEAHLASLSAVATRAFSQRTHTIDLELHK